MNCFKKYFVSIITGLLISSLLLSGCIVQQSTNDKKSSIELISQVSQTVQPVSFGYKYGMKYANEDALRYDLASEYNTWKSKYVTSDGASGGLRVRRDIKSNYDTVSEGMGYGMLFALYFSDKLTFDSMYKYVLQHRVDLYNIMHWKVDKDGNNVSEFADYKIQYPVYNTDGTYNLFIATSAKVPHGIVFKKKSDSSTIVIFKTQQQVGEISSVYANQYNQEIEKFKNNSEYYVFCKEPRQLNSATDADVDIAAALALASYKWANERNTIDYLNEAKKWINDFYYSDTSGSFTDRFIRAGNWWGNQTGWNPSYVTPAWYKLFMKLKPEINWQSLIDNCYKEMNKIPQSGGALFPDWCDTSGLKKDYFLSNGDLIIGDEAALKPTTISDRQYILDDKTTIAGLMSFNSYYDAVRVPWRLALDYSWNGDQNAQELLYIMKWFVKKTGINNLKDGYTIYGQKWDRNYRDGFNNPLVVDSTDGLTHNGGETPSPCFYSMYSTVSLYSTDDQDFASQCFNVTRDNKEKNNPDQGHCYYGDCLRLLSLLYITGKMVDYSDKTTYTENIAPTNNYVRIKNQWQNTYLNIEHQMMHFIECGNISNNWLSAKWQMSVNNEGYYTFKCLHRPQGYDGYIHLEDKFSYAEWDTSMRNGNPNPGWLSAQWIIESTSSKGVYRLKNRWTGNYLHIEDKVDSGYNSALLQSSLDGFVPSDWASAKWIFEPVQ